MTLVGGTSLGASSDHVIVLPGGGYADHAANEGEPIAQWLRGFGVAASVFHYPLMARHPAPLNALRAEIRRVRAAGSKRIRLILLGEDASPELRRATSLEALVTTKAPPFFIWHTAEDPYVPVEHAYRLA